VARWYQGGGDWLGIFGKASPVDSLAHSADMAEIAMLQSAIATFPTTQPTNRRRVPVSLRPSMGMACPCFRHLANAGKHSVSAFAAVGGVSLAAGVDGSPMLDQLPRPLSPFAALPHRAVGFDSLNTQGSSNAALQHSNGGIFYAQKTALPVGGSNARGLMPASFLECWSVNLHSARLFRLTAKEAGTSTQGVCQ